MWGQAPKTWEVLVEEDSPTHNNTNKINNNDNDNKTFQRSTTKVLPAIGCGLDSLDTIRTKELYQLDNDENRRINNNTIDNTNDNTILRVTHNENKTTAVLDTFSHARNETGKTVCLETIFALPTEHHRLRVSLGVSIIRSTNDDKTCYDYELDPIRTYWERRYDILTTENLGILAENAKDVNGFLDAGTVFGLIGKELRNCEKEISNPPLSQEDAQTTTTDTILKLPRNLVIAHGAIQQQQQQQQQQHPGDDNDSNRGWYLEVGLGKQDTDELRTVVRREFHGFDCNRIVLPS